MNREVLPCRVAILGLDSEMSQLLQAAISTPSVHLVACYDVSSEELSALPDTSADAIRSIRADDVSRDDWESLLSEGFADLVFVSRPRSTTADRDLRNEQLRRLVQASVPLVVSHPPCDMLLAYELQMIRHDSACPIFPYVPAALHPGMQAIKHLLTQGNDSLGRLEQITCERQIVDSERSRSSVRDAVARDVVVLQQWLIDITAVSATGAEKGAEDWGRLAVHLTSPDDRFARWSTAPARGEPTVSFHVIGSRHSIDATLSMQSSQVAIEDPAGMIRLPTEEDWHPAHAFLSAVINHRQHDAAPPHPTWDEACRSLEVVDAVERSLQRRRTIELYHEQVTEQDTFKSMMAAGGCGMLMWVLTLLIVAGIVEGLNLPVSNVLLQRTWIALLILPLLVFLGLQLLQLVFAGEDRAARHKPIDERPSDESLDTTV